uniref:Uncharacterized protein n=1 Tax=Chromera velia CCMP2878 TaxID=1169474 RepID=A0A0G4GSI2_9ALVE|eukprot:Cvel_23189.t1-p1 / transcript=Cvel_23189.t1 / gene=Cvel_23189 / organism=Chromera_velia_CCMP2878 / gene_product=hypothetical protein / transcript_product=hypothetical protein / location=Cvel_scaffold2362:15860-17305(+) / protein_length=122 / sequence_SO=supercontig / SO=protein_coding / is_pseudo=false
MTTAKAAADSAHFDVMGKVKDPEQQELFDMQVDDVFIFARDYFSAYALSPPEDTSAAKHALAPDGEEPPQSAEAEVSGAAAGEGATAAESPAPAEGNALSSAAKTDKEGGAEEGEKKEDLPP